MKKRSALLLACLLILAMGIAPSAHAETFLSIATGGTSGTYYPLGGDIANLFNSTIDGIKANAQATGGTAENLRLINAGDAELGTVQNDVSAYAFEGIDSFDGEVIDTFSVITSLYPEVVQLVARADVGIDSIEDLKGKRVSVGAAGSGTYFNAIHMLEAAGMSLDDIDEQFLSFSESGDAAKNRQIDAFFCTAGIPNAAITELTSGSEAKVIALDGATIDAMIAAKPFYVDFTIPGGTYPGIDDDVRTVAITALLVCTNDLDEDLVYQMTKSLYEKGDELLTHAKKTEITLDTALDGVGNLPIHPGAERYYKEVGLM
ncbi:TAXI family TRAP transporter solute-binding subunit [Eubacteriales bacterium OttesenSCG-928-A19]|nr:TAXI family TRAP transporter solute-binding subunit [Eubacteriales bacterium OttesenSCG-928-A19]